MAGCSVLVVTVRQLVPEGLVEIPPGPELARVLADLEPSRLSGFDCVRLLQAQYRQVQAQYRQANHERAKVMAVMAEVGLCGGVGPAGRLISANHQRPSLRERWGQRTGSGEGEVQGRGVQPYPRCDHPPGKCQGLAPRSPYRP